MTVSELRTKHPQFIFEDFSWQLKNSQLQNTFQFSLSADIHFSPTLTINHVSQSAIDQLDPQLWRHLLFHLGLAEIPSYWKSSCSPEIVIKVPGVSMTPGQVAWWQDLLIKGLGEFYFVNQIDFTQPDFVKIIAPVAAQDQLPGNFPAISAAKPRYLVPVGGGKDSALGLGLLAKAGVDYACLLLYPQSPAAALIAQTATPGQPSIELHRQIDQKLLELNQHGYLNGHTPFSSYLAFASLLAAYLFNFSHILVANESSANEPNLFFHNQPINHQYSKSLEFETKFRTYVSQYLTPSTGVQLTNQSTLVTGTNSPATSPLANPPQYLSFLRPLNELQIAAWFAQNPQFHTLFRSCNKGQKQNIWCHHCPKCLFVYFMLYPFLEPDYLASKIFNHDLFSDNTLITTAQELIGIGDQKPFECVGTYAETQTAAWLSLHKFQHLNPGQPLQPILASLESTLSAQESELKTQTTTLLTAWHEPHHLTPALLQIPQTEHQTMTSNILHQLASYISL